MFICFLDIMCCVCRFYSLPSNSPGESLCKNWSIWEILCNRKTLCHGPLICFCLLTILQNGVNIWQKKKTHTQSKKQNPKLISLQLNQPHFNQSLLQMSFDCFPNPEPHYMKKDHHHRRYWKVCAIDSKNHFKSRIMKNFQAITIGLNWKSNSLRGDTEGNSTYLVYMLYIHIGSLNTCPEVTVFSSLLCCENRPEGLQHWVPIMKIGSLHKIRISGHETAKPQGGSMWKSVPV